MGNLSQLPAGFQLDPAQQPQALPTGFQLDQPQLQAPELRPLTFGEQVKGTAEGIGTLVTSAIAEPLAGISGLAGLAAEAVGVAPSGFAAEQVEAVRGLLTFKPESREGKEALAGLGEFVQPVVDKLLQLKTFLGDAAFENTSSEALAGLATAIPDALLLATSVPKVSRGLPKIKPADIKTPEAQQLEIAQALTQKKPVDVAEIIQADPAFFQAATELGVTAEPLASFASKNPQFVAVEQGLASVPSSVLDVKSRAFITDLAGRADNIIEQFGGTLDKGQLNIDFKRTALETIDGLAKAADDVYGTIGKSLPKAGRFEAPNTVAFLQEKARELGGVNELPTKLKSILKSLESKNTGGLDQIGLDLRNKLTTNKQASVAEYNARPDSQGGKILSTDIARELSPDYLNNRSLSANVHEPASAFIKERYADILRQPPGPGETPSVLFTAGGTGSGKSTALDGLIDTQSFQVVFDTNMSKFPSAVTKIDQALAAGKSVDIAMVYRDPLEAFQNGSLTRAIRQAEEFATGRTVPLNDHIDTHRGSLNVVGKLAEKYKDNPNVNIQAIDNSRGKGNAEFIDLSNLDKFKVKDYNKVTKDIENILEEAHAQGQITTDTFKGFKPNGPTTTSKTDISGAPGQPQQEIISKLEPVVNPTLGKIDQIRREVGQALNSRSGSFKDVETGLNKALYGRLAKDQEIIAKNAGLSDITEAAKSLIIQRKGIESDLVTLLGKDLNQALSVNVAGAIKGLAKNDIGRFKKVIDAIPKSQRSEIVLSALNDVFRGAGVGQQSLSPTQFVKWFQNISRSPAVKKILFDSLPGGSQKAVENLFKVSLGISNALGNRIATGRLNAMFNQDTGFLRKMVGKAVPLAVGIATGSPRTAAATNATVEFLQQSTNGAKQAADLLASSQFQSIIRQSVREGVIEGASASAKLTRAEAALQKTSVFRKWRDSLSREQLASLTRSGLIEYLFVSELEEQ